MLEYDDVANDQRKVIYQQRTELLESEDISETITAMRGDVLSNLVGMYVPAQSVEEQWDIPGLGEGNGRRISAVVAIAGVAGEGARLA